MITLCIIFSVGTFWLYAILATIGVIFFAFFLPETKGKTLEEVTHYSSIDFRLPVNLLKMLEVIIVILKTFSTNLEHDIR